tara:strand:+ start:1525 stop:3837 length:2313 start_codon:yes stop_codon:yes gene_type:complete
MGTPLNSNLTYGSNRSSLTASTDFAGNVPTKQFNQWNKWKFVINEITTAGGTSRLDVSGDTEISGHLVVRDKVTFLDPSFYAPNLEERNITTGDADAATNEQVLYFNTDTSMIRRGEFRTKTVHVNDLSTAYDASNHDIADSSYIGLLLAADQKLFQFAQDAEKEVHFLGYHHEDKRLETRNLRFSTLQVRSNGADGGIDDAQLDGTEQTFDLSDHDLSNIAHITRGYAAPHKALVLDSNKDISGIRRVTMDDKVNGLLRFATLDISYDSDDLVFKSTNSNQDQRFRFETSDISFGRLGGSFVVGINSDSNGGVNMTYDNDSKFNLTNDTLSIKVPDSTDTKGLRFLNTANATALRITDRIRFTGQDSTDNCGNTLFDGFNIGDVSMVEDDFSMLSQIVRGEAKYGKALVLGYDGDVSGMNHFTAEKVTVGSGELELLTEHASAGKTFTIKAPSTLIIDPHGFDDTTGTLIIDGDLMVRGSTVTINSSTLDVSDSQIRIASAITNQLASGARINGQYAGIMFGSNTATISQPWYYNSDNIGTRNSTTDTSFELIIRNTYTDPSGWDFPNSSRYAELTADGTAGAAKDTTNVDNVVLLSTIPLQSNKLIACGYTGTIQIGNTEANERDLYHITGVTEGLASANKVLVADAHKDVSGLGHLTLDADSHIRILGDTYGAVDIDQDDLSMIDDITRGTASASKAVVLDTNKDIKGIRDISARRIAMYGTGETSLYLDQILSQFFSTEALQDLGVFGWKDDDLYDPSNIGGLYND